jgi:hypothetical protein
LDLPQGRVAFEVALLFSPTGEEFDLSDRPTSGSRVSVKDKATPENLTRTTVVGFFNTIAEDLPHRQASMIGACELLLEGPLRVGSRGQHSGLVDASLSRKPGLGKGQSAIGIRESSMDNNIGAQNRR